MTASSRQNASHIAAVTLIFPEDDQTVFFCDLKDEGYIFPWSLIMTGGNWVGEGARADKNPNDTAAREIMEELTLTPKQQRGVEADLLFGGGSEDFTRPRPLIEPTSADRNLLENLKRFIVLARKPFSDFWCIASGDDLWRLSGDQYKQRMSKKGLSRADNLRGICSVGLSPLPRKSWADLLYLQNKYRNISQESLSFVASLENIVSTGLNFSYGQDKMYQRILLRHGYDQARNLSCAPEYLVEEIGEPMDTYQDYLDLYEVAKKPI